jgi:hypothetical protein
VVREIGIDKFKIELLYDYPCSSWNELKYQEELEMKKYPHEPIKYFSVARFGEAKAKAMAIAEQDKIYPLMKESKI